MENHMKDNLKMEFLMDMEYINIRMEIHIKEILKKEKSNLELWNVQMVQNMKVILKMIIIMEKEF